ncbi:Major Facilitator Superfamily protein [Natronincola peptidivorans]|uniref:Major Facilitator Superfamily protein n=1 Tax=Natronincola peptidivorans TaxID=426128 RepID=A0A1I0A5V3_9FIRM|nr:MFS transporter [Natronincola peptidivorans]SES88591.1 Major Facilitator Superfamily protein [Natronincola peptidivorans]
MKVRLFYLYKFLQDFVPIYPVYLLLFESKGISVAEISLLLAIWSVPVVLLEVPAGLLADYWSRKNMMLIAVFLKATGYTAWFISDGFFLFAIGFVFWGASEAFRSGSEEAYLYDTLKEKGEEASFDKILGKSYFYSTVGVTIATLMGGFMAMFLGMKVTLVLSILSMILCSFIVLRFKEVNYFLLNNQHKAESKLKRSIGTLKEATKFCVAEREIFIMGLLAICIVGTADLIDEYDQLIASRYGLSMGFIGVWMAIRYFLSSIGGAGAYKLKLFLEKNWIKERFHTVLVLSLMAAVFLGVSGYVGKIVIMPLYGLFYLVMAAAHVLQEDYIQQKVKEEGRSTIHSLVSLGRNLYGIIFFSLFAILLSYVDIYGMLMVVAIYIIVGCGVLNLAFHLYKKKSV